MTSAFGSVSVFFLTVSLSSHLGSRQRPFMHGGSGSAERFPRCPRGPLGELADYLLMTKNEFHNFPESAVRFRGVVESRVVLAGVGPEWQALADGLRLRPPGLEEFDFGTFDHGLQFFAARAVEERFFSSTIWPRLSPHRVGFFQVTVGAYDKRQCLFRPRSVAGGFLRLCPLALAGAAVFLTSLATTVQRARGLGCLGAVGSRWRMRPREFVEKRARVSSNVFLRDHDIPVARHLEVVADGLPFFRGAQVAVDTTWVSLFRPTATRAVVVQRRMVPLSRRPAIGNN